MRAGGEHARGFQAGAAERPQLQLGVRGRSQQAAAELAVPAAVRFRAAQEPGRRPVAGRRSGGKAVGGSAEEEPAVGVARGEDARGAGAVLQRGGDDTGGGCHGAGGHRQRAAPGVGSGQQELRSPPAGHPAKAASPADVQQ